MAFGLISARYDLDRLARTDNGDYILGVYEPDTEKLFVIGSARKLNRSTETTMAHELTHAMQDQNFDLSHLMQQTGNNSDRQLALKSIVEGDATFAENRYEGTRHYSQEQLKESLHNESTTFQNYADAPAIFGEIAYFPYTVGTSWIAGLYQQGGWQAVNDAFRHPPASTEQILHPEKYLSNERPVNVRTVTRFRRSAKGGLPSERIRWASIVRCCCG